MSGISGTIMAQSTVTRWYSVCALNFDDDDCEFDVSKELHIEYYD